MGRRESESSTTPPGYHGFFSLCERTGKELQSFCVIQPARILNEEHSQSIDPVAGTKLCQGGTEGVELADAARAVGEVHRENPRAIAARRGGSVRPVAETLSGGRDSSGPRELLPLRTGSAGQRRKCGESRRATAVLPPLRAISFFPRHGRPHT